MSKFQATNDITKEESSVKLSLMQLLQDIVNTTCSQKKYSKVLSAISIDNDMLIALFEGLDRLGEKLPL